LFAQGVPNFFGTVLIGDDFLLSIVNFNLGYQCKRRNNIYQSGYCISGLTIGGAASLFSEREVNDCFKTEIIYIGSIDIANGRELIHMMNDFCQLIKECLRIKIRPIICTLAPMINYLLGNRKDTLKGFNNYLRYNHFKLPVIDINKCFLRDENNSDSLEPACFVDEPRFVTGFQKPLVMWSKLGRDRVYSMLEKNLGLAIMSSSTDKAEVFDYI
jgi:hypothetical protein